MYRDEHFGTVDLEIYAWSPFLSILRSIQSLVYILKNV